MNVRGRAIRSVILLPGACILANSLINILIEFWIVIVHENSHYYTLIALLVILCGYSNLATINQLVVWCGFYCAYLATSGLSFISKIINSWSTHILLFLLVLLINLIFTCIKFN